MQLLDPLLSPRIGNGCYFSVACLQKRSVATSHCHFWKDPINSPHFLYPSFHGNEKEDQSWHVKAKISL